MFSSLYFYVFNIFYVKLDEVHSALKVTYKFRTKLPM